MEMQGGNIAASTYAMKKALAMPTMLMDLVASSAVAEKQPLATTAPAPTPSDLAALSGKGGIIDLVV